MADPLRIERAIHELCKVIDADEPPGLAARTLARAAVALLKDRDGVQAIAIADKLNRLNLLFPRPRQ